MYCTHICGLLNDGFPGAGATGQRSERRLQRALDEGLVGAGHPSQVTVRRADAVVGRDLNNAGQS